MTKDISYIIPFRAANPERLHALYYVLRKLRNYFPDLEIIVVEQDAASQLTPDAVLNFKHIFLSHAGPFNKCWALNVAAARTDKSILVFGDSDMFLSKEDYLSCFLAAQSFDAVTPNKTEAINIEIADDKTEEFTILNRRPLYTFAGGIVIFTRRAFEKVGGWDEDFEGWGGEDDVMSHVVYNVLSSKTFSLPFYHIDHPRTAADGQQQANYQANRDRADEIRALSGAAMTRYLDGLKQKNRGETDKYTRPKPITKPKRKFVLAATTYNRCDYLKACISSFLTTRNTDADWQIIIADDGSTDATKAYLAELEREHGAVIIRNNRTDVHRQMNTILRTLVDLDFDFCFKCDDDVLFHAAGWDDLYYSTAMRTSFEHLIFYDTSWRPHANLDRPIRCGGLVSACLPENIQGGFYTLTPDIIRTVGYFDEQQFGRRGVGHVDFSFRCCRAGFNALAHPFDAAGSNDFIGLQRVENYLGSVSSKYKSFFNPQEIIEFKRKLTKANRLYIPYNENFTALQEHTKYQSATTKEKVKKSSAKFSKVNAAFYPERGVLGFIGFLLKRFYNLSITLKLYFIPAGLKKLGKFLNKTGIDLMNIED